MRKVFHPVSILTLFAIPFVVYSQGRTGGFSHFLEGRLLRTHCVWEAALLIAAVVACGIGYQRKNQKRYNLATIAAICAYLALQAAGIFYPPDYKIWVYVVAPVFAWSILVSSLTCLFTAILKRKAPHRPTGLTVD